MHSARRTYICIGVNVSLCMYSHYTYIKTLLYIHLSIHYTIMYTLYYSVYLSVYTITLYNTPFASSIMFEDFSYQHKLIKMCAELANSNHCTVLFLTRAGAKLCWYESTCFWFLSIESSQKAKASNGAHCTVGSSPTLIKLTFSCYVVNGSEMILCNYIILRVSSRISREL